MSIYPEVAGGLESQCLRSLFMLSYLAVFILMTLSWRFISPKCFLDGLTEGPLTTIVLLICAKRKTTGSSTIMGDRPVLWVRIPNMVKQPVNLLTTPLSCSSTLLAGQEFFCYFEILVMVIGVLSSSLEVKWTKVPFFACLSFLPSFLNLIQR